MPSTAPSKRDDFFLVDCNQFFVSCECVFQPKLLGKPVVVLSNNDGCVVARSKQAKALGIPMGAPAFQFKELFKKEKVHVLSSNFALYANMSQRVMQVLSSFSEQMEEYSIDEAFLCISSNTPLQIAADIRNKVFQWTGIPVSIGVGSTKTLAKVASEIAKKDPTSCFAFETSSQVDEVLKDLPASEIWGIGPRLNQRFKNRGIRTALQFKNASDFWIQRHFSIQVLRTAWELRGISCSTLEDTFTPRKSITCSRSFGIPVRTLHALAEAISSHTANAAVKLREQNSLASWICVFVATSFDANSRTLQFPEPTDYSPLLIHYAKQCLDQLYREDFLYKKAGITLIGLVENTCYQRDLFYTSFSSRNTQNKAMALFDEANRKWGRGTLRFAAEGTQQEWKSKKNNCSPRFTTQWEEILTITI